MLQHPRAVYSISYISGLQKAAEYGGCSQLILMSPLKCTTKMESLAKRLEHSILYRFLYVFTNGKSLFIQFQEEIKMDTGLDDFDIFPFKDETGKPSPDQPGMF